MLKRILLLGMVIGVVLPVIAVGRSKDLGFVNYFAKYDHPDQRRGERYTKQLKTYFEELKKLGKSPVRNALISLIPLPRPGQVRSSL